MDCKTKKRLYRNFKCLNKNIPFFPFQYFQYYFLEFRGVPHKQKIRFDGKIAVAKEEDLRELQRFFSSKAKKFESRFKQGHMIVFAQEQDGRIVGYENLDFSAAHLERHSGIEIAIPQDSIYLYDAYIDPQYRMRGVWVGFKNLIGDLMVEKNRNRLMTFIEWDNPASLKSHLQFGFKIYEKRCIWRIFGKPLVKTESLTQSPQLIRALLNY